MQYNLELNQAGTEALSRVHLSTALFQICQMWLECMLRQTRTWLWSHSGKPL